VPIWNDSCPRRSAPACAAFRNAGPEAVAGFRAVLEQMMDADMRRHYLDGGPDTGDGAP
jgi:hypothetical protein